ncbi:MAG: adenine phosphoribosyltransferase [Akkermansiaceae bacterium]|nr:adenine phosphoribosyltransferase [Armatimonadota bacterium]
MSTTTATAPLRAEALIRDIPDFPQPGILFKDITPVLADADALRETIDVLSAQIAALTPDRVVGIESRGFLFGVPVAYKLGLPFSPVRKLGKLPYQTIQEEYALEYGTNTVEAHVDAVDPGDRVVIVDDLLATGGTATAAAAIVERLGGTVVGYAFLVELSSLKGRDRLDRGKIITLLTY